jgi:hypothetical protein
MDMTERNASFGDAAVVDANLRGQTLDRARFRSSLSPATRAKRCPKWFDIGLTPEVRHATERRASRVAGTRTALRIRLTMPMLTSVVSTGTLDNY